MKKCFGMVIVVGVAVVLLCYFRGCFNPPVSVSFRESLMTGYVLQVHSLSDEPLECRMSVYNDSHNQARENIHFVLPPGEMKEFGMLELDWHFDPGEHGWVSVSGSLCKLHFELNQNGRWKTW